MDNDSQERHFIRSIWSQVQHYRDNYDLTDQSLVGGLQVICNCIINGFEEDEQDGDIGFKEDF